MLSIAYPTQLANFIVGWLNAYQAWVAWAGANEKPIQVHPSSGGILDTPGVLRGVFLFFSTQMLLRGHVEVFEVEVTPPCGGDVV